MAASLVTRRSTLHAFHLSANATMSEVSGWQCPNVYRSVEDEVQAVQERVGLHDASSLTTLEIQGKDTLSSLAEWLSVDAPQTGAVARIQPQALSLAPDTNVLLCCLTKNRARLLTPPGTAHAVQSQFASAKVTDCIHITDITSSLTAIQIAGPRSREVLSKLTALDLRPTQFPDLSCAQISLAKVHTFVIRADIQTHLSYQIYCGREFGEYMWEALLDAGQEFAAIPVGMAAQQRLQAQG